MVASVVMKNAVAEERREGGKTEAGAETEIWTEEIEILFVVHQKKRVDRVRMMTATDFGYHRIAQTTAIGSGGSVNRPTQELIFWKTTLKI